MAEITNELIYEVLKQMQNRLSNIENGVTEVRSELVAIRGHLGAVQVDTTNLYSGQAGIEMRLSRIERRLELVDSPLS